MTFLLMHIFDYKHYPQLIGTKEDILEFLYNDQGKDAISEIPELFQGTSVDKKYIREYYESYWNPQKVEPYKWTSVSSPTKRYQITPYFIDFYSGVQHTGDFGYYVLSVDKN